MIHEVDFMNDSRILVIDNDYIQQLIENQDNIEDLDTISSATVTSNALKKMIINVIQDYN